MIGRFGTVRIGTIDEHPLKISDLKRIRRYFIDIENQKSEYIIRKEKRKISLEVKTVFFARLLARAFEYKNRPLNYITTLIDKFLSRNNLFFGFLYHFFCGSIQYIYNFFLDIIVYLNRFMIF